MSASLVDLQFIDARARVLDVAAFLDRLERHGQSDDPRVVALRASLSILSSDAPHRARRLLEAWSDPTLEPIPAATTQGALGAWLGPPAS
jgi:hypothetical protein